MPVKTIPFVGQPTQRGLMTRPAFTASQDQRFINCLFTKLDSPLAKSTNIYVEKRQGLETYSTPASGDSGGSVFVSPAQNTLISTFTHSGVISIYSNTTNCGTLDSGITSQINEAVLSGTSYVIFTTSAGIGWFLPSDAVSGFTFTANTHTSTTIDTISSMTGLYVGQLLSGSGIQANTRIATINVAGSSITTTLATTTSASITITREGVAKIINANFPSAAYGLVEMDGYIFTADTTNNRIYNSDLNSITSWTANNYISTNISSDTLQFVAKYKNRILGCGIGTIEQFYNAGNPSGSPLSSDKNSFIQVGAVSGFTQTNEYLFFVGPSTLNPGIWMLSSDGLKKISTPVIDRNLSSLALFASSLSSIFYAGYTWLIFFAASGTIFFYCVEIDSWNEQLFTSSIVGANSNRRTSNTAGPFFLATSTGKIYTWDGSPTYQDDSSAYTMTIQTEPYSLNGGKPFIINTVDLIADTQASGSSTLEKTVDDYGSYETLGTFDLTSPLKRIQPGGYCDSNVAFRLTDSGNQAWRGQALIVDWTPCQ